MDYIFMVGLITLCAVAALFYVVLFSFIFYWHLKKVSFIAVPMIFLFEFLVMGFFVVAIVSVIFNFLPSIAAMVGTS